VKKGTVAHKVAAKKAPAQRKAGSSRVAVKKKTQAAKVQAAKDAKSVTPAASEEGVVRKPPTRSTPAVKSSIAATRKKGSGRRGIQLKSLGKPGDDGLN
jgi:hypothetical protein